MSKCVYAGVCVHTKQYFRISSHMVLLDQLQTWWVGALVWGVVSVMINDVKGQVSQVDHENGKHTF